MKTFSTALSALLFANVAASEPLRCGRWVVDVPLTVEELLQKCGEPDSKRFEESDVRPMGRAARGVRGMRLGDDHRVNRRTCVTPRMSGSSPSGPASCCSGADLHRGLAA